MKIRPRSGASRSTFTVLILALALAVSACGLALNASAAPSASIAKKCKKGYKKVGKKCKKKAAAVKVTSVTITQSFVYQGNVTVFLEVKTSAKTKKVTGSVTMSNAGGTDTKPVTLGNIGVPLKAFEGHPQWVEPFATKFSTAQITATFGGKTATATTKNNDTPET